MVGNFFTNRWTHLDDLLVSEGLKPSEVTWLQEGIRSTFSPFLGGERGSFPTIEESANKLAHDTSQLDRVGATAVFTANRIIEDQFRYNTTPATRAIANLGSQYAAIIGEALQIVESEKYSWGQRARGAVQAAGVLYTAYDFVRNFRRTASTVRAARTAFRVGAAGAAVATGGLSIVPTLLSWLAFEAALFAAQKIGEAGAHSYATTQGRRHIAQAMFDKERTVAESKLFLGTLSGGPFSGDRGFDYLSQIRSTQHLGLSAGDFGYTYQQLGGYENFVAQMTPYAEAERSSLIGRSLVLSNALGIDDEAVLVATTSLSRIAGQTAGQVTEQFIDFFGALSGDGTLVLSHAGIVGNLAEYARSYGYSAKFNDNAAEEIAKITSYLRDSDIVGVQQATAITGTISNLDELLMAGATSTNRYANRILANAGINHVQATRGLTGDASLLPLLLESISAEAGIDSSSFGPDGITEEALSSLAPVLVRGLRMDATGVNQVIAALETHHTGRPSERYSSVERGIAYSGEQAASSNNVQMIMSIVEQEIALSDAIRTNAMAMMDVNEATVNAFLRYQVPIADKTADIVAKIAGILNQPQVTSRLNLSSPPFPGAQSTLRAATQVPPPPSGVATARPNTVPTGGMSASYDLIVQTASGVTRLPYVLGSALAPIPAFADTGNLNAERAVTNRLNEVYLENSAGRLGSPFSSVEREVEAILGLMKPWEADNILRLAPGFLEHFVIRSREFGVNPIAMLPFLRLETGGNWTPTVSNPSSSATGLLQFTNVAMADMGVTYPHLLGMSLSEQLDLAYFYFINNAGLEFGGDISAFQLYLKTAGSGIDVNVGLDEVIYERSTAFAMRNPSWQNEQGDVTGRAIGSAINVHARALYIDVTADYIESYPEMAVYILDSIEQGIMW